MTPCGMQSSTKLTPPGSFQKENQELLSQTHKEDQETSTSPTGEVAHTLLTLLSPLRYAPPTFSKQATALEPLSR